MGQRKRKLTSVATPPGIDFEKAVARVQQLLEPASKVTHNELIVDRVGIARQFDVVIRGRYAGTDFLGVGECKDHKRRKGLSDIDAFSKKCENLRANFKLMVSRNGFTSSALKLAQHEGIVCLSLVPKEPNPGGFMIGDTWYGKMYGWRLLALTVHFPPVGKRAEGFEMFDVKWKGQPVVDYFIKELLTTHSHSTEEGQITLAHTFRKLQMLDIAGDAIPVLGISVVAERYCRKKKKWVSWIGDGFYDWVQGKVTFAPNSEIRTTGVEKDLTTWDDFDGEIPGPDEPNHSGLARMIFSSFPTWDGSRTCVDLSKL